MPPACIPAAPTWRPPPSTRAGLLSTTLHSLHTTPLLNKPSHCRLSKVKILHPNFSGLSSSASPLTGPICLPQPPITKPVSSRPGWRGQLQALLELRKLPQKGPQKRELPYPAPPHHNLPPEVTSESGLSDESSSPEGDALWVGFERNQLNQPNPELWKREGEFCGL